jgi:hypothetical protein
MGRRIPKNSVAARHLGVRTTGPPSLHPLSRVVSIFLTLICLFGSGPQAWGAITDNLIAGYRFDEASGNAVDVLSAHDLTETSGTIEAVTGKVDGGRDFEAGDTEYFAATGITPTTGNHSVSVWIKLESAPAANAAMIICSLGAVTGTQHRNFSFDYRDQSGTKMLELAWYDLVGFEEHTHNITLTTGTWYHIVWTWTPASHASVVYVNGSAATPSFTGSRIPGTGGTQSFQIGALYQTSYFDGVIDELTYWERAITAAEVANLYNGGNGRSYPYSTGAQYYYQQQSAVERDKEQFYAAIGQFSETDWRLVR